MVKDDHEYLEIAKLHLALIGEANRQAQCLPPWMIKQIQRRADPETERATLVGPLSQMSKEARREYEDVLTWLVNKAREQVAQTGDQPALRVVRSSSRPKRRRGREWAVAALLKR